MIGWKDGLLILSFLPLTIPSMEPRGRHLLGSLFGGSLGEFPCTLGPLLAGPFRGARDRQPVSHRF